MPSKQKPILFLRDKLSEMISQTNRAAKPVYAAGGLLLLASTLTLVTVFSLNTGKPFPTAPPDKTPPVQTTEKTVQSQTRNVQPTLQQPVQSTAQSSVKPDPAPAMPDNKSIQAKVEETIKQPAIVGTPVKPLIGTYIQQFGWQMHPVFKDWRYHNGIDIAAAKGDAVVAIWPGEVTEIYQDKMTGLTVSVRSGEFIVQYGALAAAEIKKGSIVKAGSRVGAAGASQGEPYPHLHLSIKKGDTYIDPLEKLQ